MVSLRQTWISAGSLVDGDRLADEALGDGVAVGVDRDIAVQIDDAFEQFVNRRQGIGQRHKVRPLDDVGRFRRHAERLLGFVIGDVAAPGDRLAVEVVEVLEVASGQEIVLDIGEGTLDPAFAVGVADPVGAETKAKSAGEGQHLRGDDGIGTGAGGEQHAGIVDDADRADAIHEASRLEQERLGLEAGEARIVLNEQPARVGQHQPGALHGDDLAGRPRLGEHHAVRRGVVLHLLSGREVVFAGAPRRSAQARLPDPTGQGAVAHRETVVGQQFLDADHVAAGSLEGGLQPDQCRLVARRRFVDGSVRLTQDAPHGITRQRQAAADLAQAVTFCLQGAHRITDLGRGHARPLSGFR